MADYVFKMPDIGEGVVEGEVVAWHVKPGDSVVEDQPLVDLMTDKATVTIPSIVHGRVVRTNGAVGDRISVGGELIVFDLPEGESPSGSTTNATAAPESKAQATTPTLPRSTVERPSIGDADRLKPLASPSVRWKAKERGIDLANVDGSGPGGRVTHDDLDRVNSTASKSTSTRRTAAPTPSSAPRTGKRVLPYVGVRRKIGERLQWAKRNIPHYSFWDEVDVSQLSDLRDSLNERSAPDFHLTYLPLVLTAIVRALEIHPSCNAWFDEPAGSIVEHEAIHLGIAAQTEKGLMVPVVRHAESLDLWNLAGELKRVTGAVKAGSATKEMLTGSTFTVTSLGKLGGLGATPIINPPEVGIIGVHKVEDRAVVRDGRVVPAKMMNLSCSFDHRIVDGYTAAEMMKTVKDHLERPALMFVRPPAPPA